MHLKGRNVNDLFYTLVRDISSGQIPTTARPSRYGDVLQIEEPVIITYSHPRERVLFNAARDANPFMHAFEALWMLAGRNDVEPLAYYVKRMREFSDDGETFNGAYGMRWRSLYASSGDMYDELDQLEVIIGHLRKHPESRRAVLQMWNANDDLLKIGHPVEYSKDVCCNLSALFSIRSTAEATGESLTNELGWAKLGRVLDMTVFNRSNDLIWGALGANVVHFSMLQEYVANCLGVGVGVYNQVTNNLHVYTSNWEPEKWLKQYQPKQLCPDCYGPFDPHCYVSQGICDGCGKDGHWDLRQRNWEWEYATIDASSIPLVKDQDTFDDECARFAQTGWGDQPIEWDWQEPFIGRVMFPMRMAFHYHKQRMYGNAIKVAENIAAADWRKACVEWLQRRARKWKEQHTCDHHSV